MIFDTNNEIVIQKQSQQEFTAEDEKDFYTFKGRARRTVLCPPHSDFYSA